MGSRILPVGFPAGGPPGRMARSRTANGLLTRGAERPIVALTKGRPDDLQAVILAGPFRRDAGALRAAVSTHGRRGPSRRDDQPLSPQLSAVCLHRSAAAGADFRVAGNSPA